MTEEYNGTGIFEGEKLKIGDIEILDEGKFQIPWKVSSHSQKDFIKLFNNLKEDQSEIPLIDRLIDAFSNNINLQNKMIG